MNRTKPWVKALEISPHEFEEWTTQVEPQSSVTFWALDKGKIKAQDYLLWAREHYQLPVLKDSYFKDYCNQTLWKQIQTVANWSPEMLPIEQWDGVVYVACVEPPSDVNWSFPVLYVLASARSLKAHYKRLTSGESYASVHDEVFQAPPAPVIPEAPPELPPELPQAVAVEAEEFDHISKINIPPPPGEENSEVSELRFQQTSDEAGEVSGLSFQTPVEEPNEISELRFQIEETPEPSLNFQSVEMESASATDEDTSSSSLNLPEDFKLDLKLNLENLSPKPPEVSEILLEDKSTAPAEDVPEGLNLNLPPTPTAKTISDFEMPEGIDLGASKKPKGDSSSDEAPLGLNLKVETPAIPQTKAEKPPQEEEPKFKLNFQVSTDKDEFDEPQPATNTGTEGTVTRFAVTVTGLNKEAPRGAVIDTESLAPHTADDAANDTEAVAWLFNELKANYQQSMILLFQGETLKPWKWESSWTPKSKSAFEGYQYNQPGLFRILYRTKHPYHGYVVDSPIHQKFFSDWGFEGFPHHVTALPVKVDGHLTAAVLCIGDESATSETTLVAAERLVTEFEQVLKRLTAKAA